MQFLKCPDWEVAASALAERLNKELESEAKVLWLVSGGSNVAASKYVMDQIKAGYTKKLSIMTVDERYGPKGHADSNWKQLMDGGFDAKDAILIPALEDGLSFEQTTTRYDSLTEQAFLDNKVVIAQLGIGPDGHTAGILPNSVATEPNSRLVVNYVADPYKRLTLSFTALKKVTVAYVLAFGSNKMDALIVFK
jgi:6-phosphogluconolactonase/glucosamine-6-phosphate isomerase/deaminase